MSGVSLDRMGQGGRRSWKGIESRAGWGPIPLVLSEYLTKMGIRLFSLSLESLWGGWNHNPCLPLS